MRDVSCPESKPGDIVFASVIALGLLVCYIPQHHKIITRKNSEGINPWFLLAGAVSITCNLFNILILQGSKIYVNDSICFENAIGVIQITIKWMMFIMIFVFFMAYFSEKEKYTDDLRLGDGSQKLSTKWHFSIFASVAIVIIFFLTLIISGCFVIFLGEGHDLTKFWADSLGILSVILASIQYVPQIWETWDRKAVGALSIYMLIGSSVPFLLAYYLYNHENSRLTTWIPFLIIGCFQVILLALCLYLYYSYGGKYGSSRNVDEPDGPNERSSLLDPQPNIFIQ